MGESPFGRAAVIANPRAGKGKVGRDPAAFARLIESSGIEFDLHITEGRGHATEIARQATEQGCRFLVAVGGDGTIHEVVNGMMGESGLLNSDAVLGVVAAGSGSDLIRTFGLPQRAEEAVSYLRGDNVFVLDVGKVTVTRESGTHTQYFANIAEAGFGADVGLLAERIPRWVGKLRYLICYFITLARFSIGDVRITLDERVYEGPLTNLVVANCQFFGGGMKIAPKAMPDDGRFDVLVIRGNKRDYVRASTKVFKGEHVPSPFIKEFYAAKVHITAEKALRVEADGEILGFTPATYEIVPNALRLKI